MYQGVYHGSKKHEPDLDKVLRRAWENGMDKMIITGGSLNDSKTAIDLANSDCKFFFKLSLLCFRLNSALVCAIYGPFIEHHICHVILLTKLQVSIKKVIFLY